MVEHKLLEQWVGTCDPAPQQATDSPLLREWGVGGKAVATNVRGRERREEESLFLVSRSCLGDGRGIE